MIEIDGEFFPDFVTEYKIARYLALKIYNTIENTLNRYQILVTVKPKPAELSGGIVSPHPSGSPVIKEPGEPETIINVMPDPFLDRLHIGVDPAEAGGDKTGWFEIKEKS